MDPNKHNLHLSINPAPGREAAVEDVLGKLTDTLRQFGVTVDFSQDGTDFTLAVDFDAGQLIQALFGGVLGKIGGWLL